MQIFIATDKKNINTLERARNECIKKNNCRYREGEILL